MKTKVEFAIVKGGNFISFKTEKEAKANANGGKVFKIKVLA